MKKFLFFIMAFIAGITLAKAQVNPLDTLGYRMSVVSNVKDVALVTGMTQAEQINLANFFTSAENTLNTAVSSGSSGEALKQTQNQLITQFQSLLTAQELALYRQQRPASMYAQTVSAGN